MVIIGQSIGTLEEITTAPAAPPLSTLTLFEGGMLTVFEGLGAGRGRGLEGTRPLGGTRAARGA